MEKYQSAIISKTETLKQVLGDVGLNIYHAEAFCDLATNNILPDMGNSSETDFMFAITAAILHCCNEIERAYSAVFHGLNEICDEIEKRQGVTA